VPRQRERIAVELTCTPDGRIGDPRFVRLAARQLRKSDREHRLSRRCDDELTARAADGDVPRRRISEHADRVTRIRQRVVE
jgi:hypothetical protein